jgi:hypothetical protein
MYFWYFDTIKCPSFSLLRMKQVFLTFTLVIFLFSCKKKEDVVEGPKYTSYSAMSAGNYWIYEVNHVDVKGQRTFDSYDSIYVSGDTIIRGNVYHIYYNGQFRETNMLRDSLNYIVNHIGGRIFSSENFSDVLATYYQVYGDTFCKTELRMIEKDAYTTLPAGTFRTSNARYIHYIYPKYNAPRPILHNDVKYAAGIGMVYDQQVFAMSNGEYIERRLLRYKVK